jgi:hypothetical protein
MEQDKQELILGHPASPPSLNLCKLKSLQDLSIRVNPEVTEVVVHYADL